MVQPPLCPPTAGKGLAEQFGRAVGAEEVDLVWRLFVRISRRDHHLVHAEIVIEEVEDVADSLWRIRVEERGVGGDPKALGLSGPDGRHGLVERPGPTDRGVVALLESVDVDHPAETSVGLEPVQLPLQKQCVGAQVHETAPVEQGLGHPVDLRVQQRFPARDGDHGRPRFLDGGDRLLDRQPPAQHLSGVLDLAAAVARQVAGEQRFQLDDQRELVPPGQLLPGQVGADFDALTKGNAHSADLQG